MEFSSVLAISAAGVAAGAINAIAGGGSLVTFPVLLSLGFPPVTANVTNTVAAVPGYIGGAWGYRRELKGQTRRLAVLASVTALGALAGSTLLLLGPENAFVAAVPWLILTSTLLLALQPLLTRLTSKSAAQTDTAPAESLRNAGIGQLFVALYGGYFNAGLGIMMLGVLGVALREQLHRLNALKGVLSAVASGVSMIFFAILASVSWPAAAIMAVSGLFGGWLGAAFGRRIPVSLLRWSVVTFGLVIFAILVARSHAP